MSECRVFIGPVDSEFLGAGSDGVPVLASDEGVEPMVEIGLLTEIPMRWVLGEVDGDA